MSAWIPAPPPLSDPAMIRTRPLASLMPRGLADRRLYRKGLYGLADIVGADRGDPGAGSSQRRRHRAAQAVVGGLGGGIKGADEALAADAEHDRKTQGAYAVEIGQKREVVFQRLAEADAGVEPDA